MSSVQQANRKAEQIEELCSTVIRSFTANPDHYFHGRRFYHGSKRQPVFAAYLQADGEDLQLRTSRALADSFVLRNYFNDAELHRSLCPEDNIRRLVFELLEQLRVDSLVPDDRPGMKINLERRFIDWSARFYQSGISDTSIGNLLYTLAQVVWARLNNRQVLEHTEDHIEATRAGIANVIGGDLAGMKKQRHDQEAFAQHALAIADIVVKLIEVEEAIHYITDIKAPKEIDIEKMPEFELLVDFDEEDLHDGVRKIVTGGSKSFEFTDGKYTVFNREFDTVESVDDMIRPELLLKLRGRLDSRIRGMGINVGQLARHLKMLFAVPARDDWNFGEEEGYIDGRRLSQLLTSPSDRRLFKNARYLPKADTSVTFLLDCSGSMKKYSDEVPVMIDVFGRALEQAGVGCEILGYTTHGWNGGRLMGQWMREGRPDMAGRLNELCHMVFKDANTSWRKARNNLGALLKMDFYRENIDGEAVEWACERLYKQDVGRRILIVVTDGSPLDTATVQANDKFYLDNHLKKVVSQHEARGVIEILGLGVGLDLSPFYRHCHAIDLDEGLSMHGMMEVVHLMAGKVKKR